jgi:hypothetical protein
MSKTLFIGDSHAHGYYEIDNTISAWQDNNYAEIYAKHHNKQAIIYSQPGGCNRKYPAWVKSMLEKYDDIDEVFVQSTYWNRFLLSCSKNLDVGENIKIDHYLDNDQPKDDLIHRYTDHRMTDDYIEMIDQVRQENYEDFKGFSFNDMDVRADWAPFHEKYIYTKLWHELVTPLQFKDYCLDLLAIDTMCSRRNIKWYQWSINNRVFVPDNVYLYGEWLNGTKAKSSAEGYLKLLKGIDIETDEHRLDGEHYTIDIHRLIALDYLDYVKNT